MAGAMNDADDGRGWRNQLVANYLQYDGVDFLNPLDNHDPLTDDKPTEEEYRYIIESDFSMIDEADAVFVHWDNDFENNVELHNLGREIGYATAVGTPCFVHNSMNGEVLEPLSEHVEGVFDTEGATMNAILWR